MASLALTRPEYDQDPLAMPGARPPAPLAADPAGAAGTVQVVAPPATIDTTHTTGPQSTTEQAEASPEARAALQRLTAATAAKTEATKTEQESKVDLAIIEAQHRDELAKALQQEETRKAEAAARHKEAIDAAVARDQQARAQLQRDAKITSYWEDRSAPVRIVSAFITGLADYAHLRAGGDGPSLASRELNDEMARDRQLKLDRFMASREFQQVAAQDVERAKDLLADEMKNISLTEAARRAAITGQIEAIAARAKIPMAQAAAQAFSAEQQRKDAEDEAKLYQHYDRKLSQASGHKDETHTVNDGGGKPGADLTVKAENGDVYQGRSPDDVKILRDQQVALASAKKIADRLVARNNARGRLPTMNEQQIDTTISNLLEIKKPITGAQTEADEARIKAKLKAGIIGGPEAANAAIGEFMQGLRDTAQSSLEQRGILYQRAQAAPAAAPAKKQPPAPVPKDATGAQDIAAAKKWLLDNPKAPAGQRKRIEDWIRSQ